MLISKPLRSFYSFAKDIKLSHSIFALPFVAAGILLSNISYISIQQGALILCCMISARSFSMGMNRYLDRFIDAKNPRTSHRQIPKGDLKPSASLSWSLIFALIFLCCAFSFNTIVGCSGIIVLLILGTYSITKRYTWICHLYLGACLGLAPLAAEFALTGHLSLTLFLLFLAITCWTAGFDILYSTQDIEFDRNNNLYSIPAIFGIRRSLMISRLLFFFVTLLLILIGILSSLGFFYYLGVFIVTLILGYEHYLVSDLTKNKSSNHLNFAFFNLNASVSVIYYLFTQINFLLL